MPDPETPPTSPATGPRWRRYVLALVILLVGGSALGVWLGRDLFTSRTDDVDLDPIITVANPGYTGYRACAMCHARRVVEFVETRHFMACTLPAGAKAPGFATGKGTHATADPDLRFEMTRDDEGLLATIVHQGKPSQHRIALVYGAGGTADEMYFAWHGDRLYNLPIAWVYSANRWGHAADSTGARETGPSCVECHNTWAAHIPGTANQYRQGDMILGVTCERCHGPGQKHVAYHRQHPDSKEAQAIVHPGHLSRDRLLELCTQCHGDNKRRGPAFSYRPGEPLDNYYRTAQARYPEEDQVANQVRYLRQSKCFQKSEMTCVTCHNPHRPYQAAAIQRACLKCHTAENCTDQPRLPAAVRGDCTGCHMPSRIWMNVRYHTSDDQYLPAVSRFDHWIAVHPEAKQAVLLAWLRTQTDAESRARAALMAASLANLWRKEADERRRADRLVGTIGALREALRIDAGLATRKLLEEAIARQAEFDRLVLAGNAIGSGQPARTIPIMKQILAIKPDYAPARGELATALILMGDLPEARSQLQLASRYDPEDSYCLTTLAALAYREGHWDESEGLFAKADRIDPYNATTHHGWGLALLKLERWADAEEHFRKALTIDPRHAGASEGLSQVLLAQGDPAAALLPARRAVHWTESRNAKMLLTLADVYAAAQRTADVRKTLQQALTAAEASSPDWVPLIRKRIDAGH